MDPAEHIFREYDLRGVVDRELTPEVVEAVGRAYASAARAEHAREGGPEEDRLRIVVGRDNRPSSPRLSEALAAGLLSGGVNVVDVGVTPTPVLYWAEHVLEADGGLQITGSHNPPEYNGIKMTLGKSALHGDEIRDLRRRIVEGDLAEGKGSRSRQEVLERYVEDVVDRVALERPVRAVVDCGNGTASVLAVPLLEALGAEVIPLYCESDGTFPNHHPDPSVDENLEELVAEVRDHDAEVGIAFDGDGDRLGAVDENGNVVRGDLLLLLFGLDLLKRKGPGQTLIFDVKCSQVVPDVYREAGGKPLMWKTGHSLIKKKMRETGAPLAGELSGHICFADGYYGFDDALYASAQLLALLSRGRQSLSERVASFPSSFSTPEIRIEVGEERKFTLVREFRDEFSREHEVIDVDGARVLLRDGWALMRASNTQPVVVLRFEAGTPEALRKIRERVEGWLEDRGVRT